MKRKQPEIPKTAEQAAEEQLVRDRARFQKALTSGRTVEEATDAAHLILVQANVRGSVVERSSWDDTSVSLRAERGWAMGADLSVRLERLHEDDIRYLDDRIHQVSFYRPVVEVSWSATRRSPSAARAAVVLYSEVTDLAAEIEAVLSETKIRREVKL